MVLLPSHSPHDISTRRYLWMARQNLPGVKVDLPTFTDKDVDDIVNFGIKNGVEFIAASFVRTGQDVRNLRKLLADNGGPQIKILCKIENQEGMENYDDVLHETDGIMVARGDVSCRAVRFVFPVHADQWGCFVKQ